MAPIIDFHTHVFKPWIQGALAERIGEPFDIIRRQARSWMRPISQSLHDAQTMLRHFPEPARWTMDQLSALAPLPSLFFESTAQDLAEEMEETGVDYALVIAHPGAIPNELVLEANLENPKLLPVVNISEKETDSAELLRRYHAHGARALKIHAASDGKAPDSPHYLSLLKTAADLGLPVIVHTGCIHSNLIYKKPEMGNAQLFAPWFKEFSKTPFILAHMNFHEPHVALDLAQEHPNVYVDTSWQPAETIGEAARRIGAEKVLFATDWPLVGGNQAVGIKRIREAKDLSLITEEQVEMILGGNAAKLLGLDAN